MRVDAQNCSLPCFLENNGIAYQYGIEKKIKNNKNRDKWWENIWDCDFFYFFIQSWRKTCYNKLNNFCFFTRSRTNYILNFDIIEAKIICILFIKTCFLIYFTCKNLSYNILNQTYIFQNLLFKNHN